LIFLMIFLVTTVVNANDVELTPDASGNLVLTKEQVITIANYIKDLEEENSYLTAQVEHLSNSLESERQATQKIIDETDKILGDLKSPWFSEIIPWLNLVAIGILIVRIW